MSERQPTLHRAGEFAARVGSSAPRRRWLRYVVQGGIAVLILLFLVLTVVGQWNEIIEKGVHFEAGWLPPAMALILVYFGLNSVGWELILRLLGYPIGVSRALVAWGQPLLARYVPGSVLYVLARLVLSERAGVPRRITVAAIVYEQALSVAAAIAISSWFIISHPDLQEMALRWAVLLVVPLAVVLLQPRVFGPVVNRLLRAFGREPLPATIGLGGVIGILAFFMFNWALMGVAVYFVTRAVTFVPLDQIAVVGSAQAIGYVAAVATLVAPAGLGIRDAAFAWTVKAALPSRSFALGSLIALAARAVVTVAELFFVAIVTVIARRTGYGWGGRGVAWSERDSVDQLERREHEGEGDQRAVTGEGDRRQDPDDVPR